MTVVTLQGLETALGQPVPAAGFISIQYWAGAGPYVNVDGAEVTFPALITVPIENGQPQSLLDLQPTADLCCVAWTISAAGGDRIIQRYTSIPATGPVAFGDLIDVDPRTFAPSPDAPTIVGTAASLIAAQISDPSTPVGAELSATFAKPGRLTTARFMSGMYPSRLAKWRDAVADVLSGVADARLLIAADSTAGGVGGGSASTFIQANSWPSYMTEWLDDLVAPAAHGLIVPPSNSGAVVSPFDSRWTLGTGWGWRRGGAFEGFIGFGGKGTVVVSAPGATAPLTVNDPRVTADTFDVFLCQTTGASGASFSIQATGGAAVTGQTFSQSSRGVLKVTVQAAALGTGNSVTITPTGGTGGLYILGYQPRIAGKKQILVANAGISGSSTVGWTTPPSGGAPWGSLDMIRAFAPHLTIIDLMINDCDPANPTPLSTYLANIGQIVAAAQLSGDVILKTPIPSDATRYAAESTLVAALKTLGLPLVDIFGYYGAYIPSLMSDALHGNNTMYRDEGDYFGGVLAAIPPATPTAGGGGSAPEFVLPVTGSSRIFASDGLAAMTDGTIVPSMLDMAGSGTSLTPGGTGIVSNTAPIKQTDSGHPCVAFTGTAGLAQTLSRSKPHSLIFVARVTSIAASTMQVLTGGDGASGRANVFIDTDGKFKVTGGSGYSLVGPTADTNWHVFTVVFNGTSSVFSVDGTEVAGTLAENVAAGLSIASLTDGTYRSALRLRRAHTFPYALSSTDRAAALAAVQSHYGMA